LLTYLAAIAGGAVSLSLGQMVVGLIKNPETVNSTSRLVYIAFIMLGIFGEIPNDNQYMKELHKIVIWSPYGIIKTLLTGSMEPAKWNSDTTTALFATAAYILIFSFLGIKWFKWNTKE